MSNIDDEIDRIVSKFSEELKLRLIKTVAKYEKKTIKEHTSQLKSKLKSSATKKAPPANRRKSNNTDSDSD